MDDKYFEYCFTPLPEETVKVYIIKAGFNPIAFNDKYHRDTTEEVKKVPQKTLGTMEK